MSEYGQSMELSVGTAHRVRRNQEQSAASASRPPSAAQQIAGSSGRRLLYICGFAPHPNSSSSGQKLAFRKIQEFSGDFDHIDVAYFVNEQETADADRGEPSWPANVDESLRFDLTRRMRLMAAACMPHLPMFVAVRRLAATRAIAFLIARKRYTDFYCDFSQAMAAIPPQQVPLFHFRQHDIVSKLYGRQAEYARGLKKLFYSFEAFKTRRWEASTWSRAKSIETLSADDAGLISRAHPATPTRYVPPTATVAIDPAMRTAATIVPGRLLFFGNMSRQENIDAMVWMARDILPRIRGRHPQAHLWIVGAHPSAQVLALSGPFIKVTGFVDNPMELFAQADLAVVPLRLGSGVKIKVLETLAAGIPTIATPVGGEGIPEHPLLYVAQGASAFVDRVCMALDKTAPITT